MADKPPCSIAECIHQWGTKKLGVGTGMRRRPSEVAPTGLLGNLIRESREPEILGVEQTETLFRSRISANPSVGCARVLSIGTRAFVYSWFLSGRAKASWWTVGRAGEKR